MNSVVLTPMERGQITLPKKFRDKLGITPKTPLSVSLRKKEIVVKPFNLETGSSKYVIKPKYTRSEYKKILEKITKEKTVLWTEKDDKAKEVMLQKERNKFKRLNW